MKRKGNIMISSQIAYLLGLMCARGHIYVENQRIVIEFAHKNKYAEGIAICPQCHFLATKKGNNPEGTLYCKNPKCGKEVSPSVKKSYEQVDSTKSSLREIIIPYLSEKLSCNFGIMGNEALTLLYMDFKTCSDEFSKLVNYFPDTFGFDTFMIPEDVYNASKEGKIEFINGFMDAAGFFNAGGWLNRNTEKGIGRMRAYFQIVRNWKMPVLLCNFLKQEFNLPIHTIDWGHPNIRDSALKDYIHSNKTSWNREHQLKFFPEYYGIFKPKIKHKRDMFLELIQYNQYCSFQIKEDCVAPSTITKSDVKPKHPEENSHRIPEEARKHCDAFWQVCLGLGCTQCAQKLQLAQHKDALLTFGQDLNDIEYNAKKTEYDEWKNTQDKKAKDLIEDAERQQEDLSTTRATRERTSPEQKLYAPIVAWYKRQLERFSADPFVADTSSRNLDKFIDENDLSEHFDQWDSLKIKPDIISIQKDTHRIGIIEVKATGLTLKNVGQLLGYCLVANPDEAILVSSEDVPMNLIQAINANPSILEYAPGRKIKIGQWKNSNLILKEF